MNRGLLLALAVPTSMLAAPPLALADDPPGCPPGEWFCEDSSAEPAPGEEPEYVGPEADEPLPSDFDDDERAGSARDRRVDVRSRDASYDRGWSEGSGGRAVSPWSLALRVQGVMLDARRRGEDASLGGVGVSGRYALNPVVTFDLGVDSILGTDYNGYDRSELSVSLSSLFFLNYHPVVRTYVLVGLNTSSARVDVDGDDQTWGYFGGQTGLGIEITLVPTVALNLDLVAFMRGRTDSRAAREPEFTDGLGRVTNTSGGGLLRGGIVIRF
jgi:Outer membrane protein beta-barrel domain